MRCRLLLSHQVADLLVAVEGVAGKGSAVRSLVPPDGTAAHAHVLDTVRIKE